MVGVPVRRPRFIAEQARNASGALGRLVAFVMARETWQQNLRAIEALQIEPSDRALDVGCGPGRSLAPLAARTPRGRVVGVDPSHLMVQIARRRNGDLLASGLGDVLIANAEQLPFGDGEFDKVLCVHVIYFWADLGAAFREIARVVQPGGRLALLFRSKLDETAVRSFPADVYTFRDVKDVRAALVAAGFTPEDAAVTDDSPHLLVARRTS